MHACVCYDGISMKIWDRLHACTRIWPGHLIDGYHRISRTEAPVQAPLRGLLLTHAARHDEVVGSACVYRTRESRESNPGGLLASRLQYKRQQSLPIANHHVAVGRDRRGAARHCTRTACIPNSSSSSSMETDETRHGVRARAQTEVTVTRRW